MQSRIAKAQKCMVVVVKDEGGQISIIAASRDLPPLDIIVQHYDTACQLCIDADIGWTDVHRFSDLKSRYILTFSKSESFYLKPHQNNSLPSATELKSVVEDTAANAAYRLPQMSKPPMNATCDLQSGTALRNASRYPSGFQK